MHLDLLSSRAGMTCSAWVSQEGSREAQTVQENPKSRSPTEICHAQYRLEHFN